MKAIYTLAQVSLLVLLIAILLALISTLPIVRLSAAEVLANGSGYTLDWWTVDGGGGSVSNGGSGYALMGTAGQPDAGELAGGSYTLSGGFWQGGAAAGEGEIYLPIIMRSYR